MASQPAMGLVAILAAAYAATAVLVFAALRACRLKREPYDDAESASPARKLKSFDPSSIQFLPLEAIEREKRETVGKIQEYKAPSRGPGVLLKAGEAKLTNAIAIPPTLSQSGNSCGVNAVVQAYTSLLYAKHGAAKAATLAPSRYLVYLNWRLSSNNIWDGLRSSPASTLVINSWLLNDFGPLPSVYWPYRETEQLLPPPDVWARAYVAKTRDNYLDMAEIVCNDRGNQASFNGALSKIRTAIDDGLPIVFAVSTSFETDWTKNSLALGANNVLDVPSPEQEKRYVKHDGGHAMIIYGYDHAKQHLLVQNSHGAVWGDNGCCKMTYAYLQKYWMQCYVCKLATRPEYPPTSPFDVTVLPGRRPMEVSGGGPEIFFSGGDSSTYTAYLMVRPPYQARLYCCCIQMEIASGNRVALSAHMTPYITVTLTFDGGAVVKKLEVDKQDPNETYLRELEQSFTSFDSIRIVLRKP